MDGRQGGIKRRGVVRGAPFAVTAVVLMMVVLALVAAACGGSSPETMDAGSEARMATPDTMAAAATETREGEAAPTGAGDADSGGTSQPGLDVSAASLDRKIIANATVLVEVAQGKFQLMFDQARLLADKYGGYVVSSSTEASGDESVMRSGTIALRVPEQAFSQALSDISKLGTVKSSQIQTQDVTEEYVDLQARLVNAQAQEKALLALMNEAKNVNEVLTVQQTLSQTQQEIEQLKGRLRYLEEHTSYSTITISMYEAGVEQDSDEGWGFIAALKDGVHAFMDSFNAIIVGLGGALPVLVILALLGWIGYRLYRWFARRAAERRAAQMAAPQYPYGSPGSLMTAAPGRPAAGEYPQAGPAPGTEGQPPADTTGGAATS